MGVAVAMPKASGNSGPNCVWQVFPLQDRFQWTGAWPPPTYGHFANILLRWCGVVLRPHWAGMSSSHPDLGKWSLWEVWCFFLTDKP
jgi:hypothetical protein